MKTPPWLRALGSTSLNGIICALIAITLGALIKGDKLSGLARMPSTARLLEINVPLWWIAAATLIAVVASTGLLRLRAGRSEQIPDLARSKVRTSGYDYEPSMDSKDLLMVFNDGHTWIPKHKAALAKRIIDRGQKTRILVLHPKSDFLPTAILKSGRSMQKQIAFLRETYRTVDSLRQLKPDLVEIRGHSLFNPYILHLTETVAIVHLFFLNESHNLPLLQLTNKGGDGLYEQFKDDAERAWLDAISLTDSDFA